MADQHLKILGTKFTYNLAGVFKNILNNLTYLAIIILIIGLLIVVLTAFSFSLTNRDSNLSNTYADYSEQIRNLDASSSAITSARNETLSYQEELKVVTPLIESKIVLEKSPSEEQDAYASFLSLESLVGVENSGVSVNDIHSIDDYWKALQQNNIAGLVNGQVSGALAQTQSQIISIQGQQSQIRDQQNSLENEQAILFWITIAMTLVNTIFGFRLVIVDQKNEKNRNNQGQS